MNKCSHTIHPESRTKPDRFLDPAQTFTLEETLDMPINLTRMPYEINTISPTPLDPHNVTVHGIEYEAASLEFMQASLYMATRSLQDSHPQQLANAAGEIEHQHRHRMHKNDEAMRRWREIAAKNPSDKRLTHAEAEGILQVRAGVSRIGAVVRLLARNPEMEAIELTKATRPFCTVAHILAKQALKSSIKSFASGSNVDMVVADERDAVPYRFVIDEHNHAFITKARLASAVIDGTELEIVSRESGLIYNPSKVEPIPESQFKTLGGVDVAIVPLDTTSYVRVTNQ